MERDNKKKKKKKERVQPRCDERATNPLQDFNRIPRSSNNNKNFCNICSSSSSISTEAPKGCLSFLLSSSPSSSNPSSISHLQRNPKSFSTLPNRSLLSITPKSAPNSTRPRSKENEHPKKNPSFLSQCHSSKKPTSKSSLSNSLKNSASGSRRFGVNKKDLKHKDQKAPNLGNFNNNVSDNLNDIENFTPVGKLANNSAIVKDKQPLAAEEYSNSANSAIVKTPPVEASVSPEIQCGSSNVVVASTATPVCYGAGHLISGVSDKRKCRPRGTLTIDGPTDYSGFGKISSGFEDDSNENADRVLTKSRASLIPLLAEASMRWLLSPQGKEGEENKDDNANAYRPYMDSSSMCVSSSPSLYCQFSSDLICDIDDKNGSCNPDELTSTGKTRIVLPTLRSIPNFQGFSENSCGKYGDSLVTPQARSSCETDNMKKGGGSYYGFIGEKTPSSADPLSSINVVQTPTSDSSQDRCAGISWIDEDDCQKNEFNPELGSVAESFHRTSISPRSQMPTWDPPGLSSQFTNLVSPSHSIDHIQFQKSSDNCASWISDSTVGNVSLSQMRISWREGLASRIFDIDELDCCRCSSDEEHNGDGSDEFKNKSSKAFGMKEHDSFRHVGLRSPEFLEQEPEILGKGKKALSPVRPNIWAESISTDAGGLVASEDSDWALCYKNQLFEV
ncbi:hypothetical protein ACH5RR_032355 [Cinchona calisaya]|uniref:Uncharacterized protein n=1 Tax=Cinchona calisaya TaxID=153742 RepID=A0ABD2YN48_9GENT